MIAIQEREHAIIDRVKTVSLWEIEGISCYFEILSGQFAGKVLHTDNLFFSHEDYTIQDAVFRVWNCQQTNINLTDYTEIRIYWSELS